MGATLNFIGQLVIALAVAGSGWLIHTDLRDGRPSGDSAAAPSERPSAEAADEQPDQPSAVENWERLVRSHNPARGPEDAPVTIVEFSDFECPYCGRHFQQTYPKIIEEYGDEVRMVFKHLPLAFHSNAKPAAVAAQCAAREGKFWELHDLLFRNQRSLSENNILELGGQIGLGDEWAQCFKNRETMEQVEQDLDDAQSVGVRGTPTFLVNGKIIPGAVPFRSFKQRIEAEM